MPSDLSSPRLGERAFDLLDEVSNQGLRKRLLGEVDVSEIDDTHELYAHMNVNYIRLETASGRRTLGRCVGAAGDGEFFTTTGEVLLPEVTFLIVGERDRGKGPCTVDFPLRLAEIAGGDGQKTPAR